MNRSVIAGYNTTLSCAVRGIPKVQSPLTLRLLHQGRNSCQLRVAECGTAVQRSSRGHLVMPTLPTPECAERGASAQPGGQHSDGDRGKGTHAPGGTTPLEMYPLCTKPTHCRRQTTTKRSAHNLYSALFRLWRKQQLNVIYCSTNQMTQRNSSFSVTPMHPQKFFDSLSYFAKLTRIRPGLVWSFFYGGFVGLVFLISQEYFLILNIFMKVPSKST